MLLGPAFLAEPPINYEQYITGILNLPSLGLAVDVLGTVCGVSPGLVYIYPLK